jgi:hypothetical protein
MRTALAVGKDARAALAEKRTLGRSLCCNKYSLLALRIQQMFTLYVLAMLAGTFVAGVIVGKDQRP